MSVAAVMLCKDELDVIEYTVRNLLWNVDEVIVADNMSGDGTFELLLALEGEAPGRLRVRRDPEVAHYQGRKTTALAREALARGHSWVLPCDADELWFAWDGRPIRDYLADLTSDVQVVKARMFDHRTTALDAAPEAEPNPFSRMGWREQAPPPPKFWKVCCRTRADLVIAEGNHGAAMATSSPVTWWDGLEVRHFPYRTAEQFIRKAVNGARALAATTLTEDTGRHWREYGAAIAEDGPAAGAAWFYDAFYKVDPEAAGLVHDPAPLREGG